MATNRFNTYCPFFVNAPCINGCPYKYHIRCNANLTCFNPNCQYGHTITLNFRKLFKKIIIENLNLNYEKSKNKCFYSINCLNPNCKYTHMINIENMRIINHIIKEKINYNDAIHIYVLHFRKPYNTVLTYEENVSHNPVVQTPEICDSVLESNLIKLTESDETTESNESEDIKLNLLQELMVCNTTIKLESKDIYNKDVLIFNLMRERQVLENKLCKDRLKAQQLMLAIQNME